MKSVVAKKDKQLCPFTNKKYIKDVYVLNIVPGISKSSNKSKKYKKHSKMKKLNKSQIKVKHQLVKRINLNNLIAIEQVRE